MQIPPLPRRFPLARQYKRSSDGKFSGSGGDRAETIKQNRAKKTGEKKTNKNKLSGNKLGGKGKRKRQGAKLKVRGVKVTTRAAKKSADRARKRFG